MVDPLINKQLGNYILEEKLGYGGSGVVYRARHARLATPFAVKILHPILASNEESSERFLREAQVAARVRHNNVVFIADFDIEPGIGPYFVMEFLDGESLRDLLDREEFLLPPRIVRLTRQICHALDAAHHEGITHRDLKPENIYLVKRGEREVVKLLDFGIAKITRGSLENQEQITQNGRIMGTPRYFAPEQAQGLKIDNRSDLYSLGVILYEMFIGTTPFQGTTPEEMILQHLAYDPPPLVPFGFPQEMEDFLHWVLAKNPDDRPQDVEELWDSFKEAASLISGELLTKPHPSSSPEEAEAAAADTDKNVNTTSSYLREQLRLEEEEVNRTIAWMGRATSVSEEFLGSADNEHRKPVSTRDLKAPPEEIRSQEAADYEDSQEVSLAHDNLTEVALKPLMEEPASEVSAPKVAPPQEETPEQGHDPNPGETAQEASEKKQDTMSNRGIVLSPADFQATPPQDAPKTASPHDDPEEESGQSPAESQAQETQPSETPDSTASQPDEDQDERDAASSPEQEHLETKEAPVLPHEEDSPSPTPSTASPFAQTEQDSADKATQEAEPEGKTLAYAAAHRETSQASPPPASKAQEDAPQRQDRVPPSGESLRPANAGPEAEDLPVTLPPQEEGDAVVASAVSGSPQLPLQASPSHAPIQREQAQPAQPSPPVPLQNLLVEEAQPTQTTRAHPLADVLGERVPPLTSRDTRAYPGMPAEQQRRDDDESGVFGLKTVSDFRPEAMLHPLAGNEMPHYKTNPGGHQVMQRVQVDSVATGPSLRSLSQEMSPYHPSSAPRDYASSLPQGTAPQPLLQSSGATNSFLDADEDDLLSVTPSRKRFPMVALLLLCLGGVGLVLYWGRSRKQQPPPSRARVIPAVPATPSCLSLMTLNTEPSGAEVVERGKVLGKTPYMYRGKCNNRVVLYFRAPGYLMEKRLVYLSEGMNEITFPMRKPGNNAKASVRLMVTTSPSGVSIFEKRKFLCATPCELSAPAKATRRFRLIRKGYRSKRVRIRFLRDKPSRRFTLTKLRRRRR